MKALKWYLCEPRTYLALAAVIALAITSACGKYHPPEAAPVTPEVTIPAKTVPIPAPKPEAKVVCKKGKAGARCRASERKAHAKPKEPTPTMCVPSEPGAPPVSWYERNTGKQP